MKDTQLYSQLLGIEKPWKVTGVKVSLPEDEVEVIVEHGGGKLSCPRCGNTCPGYDERKRRWRPLDTCQLKTLCSTGRMRTQYRAIFFSSRTQGINSYFFSRNFSRRVLRFLLAYSASAKVSWLMSFYLWIRFRKVCQTTGAFQSFLNERLCPSYYGEYE